jgi:hypothetical protein
MAAIAGWVTFSGSGTSKGTRSCVGATLRVLLMLGRNNNSGQQWSCISREKRESEMKRRGYRKVGLFYGIPFLDLIRASSNVFVPNVHFLLLGLSLELFISPHELSSDTAHSARLFNMALRTSLPLRPLLGACAYHTAPVLRQASAVPPRAPKTAAELGFKGNQGRTRTLDPALTKPLQVTDSSYLHLPDESQAGGSGPREQQLVSSSVQFRSNPPRLRLEIHSCAE